MSEKKLDQILEKLNHMDQRLANVEQDVSMVKMNQNRHEDLITQLLGIVKETNAKVIDVETGVQQLRQELQTVDQKVNTGFADLINGQEVLVQKLFEHEKDIRLIKKVK